MVTNHTHYANPVWFEELFKETIGVLEPKFNNAHLILTKNFVKSQTSLGMKGLELGITSLTPKGSKAYESTLWKGVIRPSTNNFSLFVKPYPILSEDLSYEEVTAGFAHEISEAIVIRSQLASATSLPDIFESSDLQIFRNFGFPNEEKKLRVIWMCARERLADKYSAEKGFGREILSTVVRHLPSASFVSDYAHSKYSYPMGNVLMAGCDKSISLEIAGLDELARVWSNRWDEVRKDFPESCSSFLDYYKKFRKELLARKLTHNSLLSLFNYHCSLCL